MPVLFGCQTQIRDLTLTKLREGELMKNATLIPNELSRNADVAELPALSTKKQVADWRQVSTRKVELDCNAGLFPQPVRCGTHPRWRRSDLLAWLDSQAADSPT